jgi:hypothetical protein
MHEESSEDALIKQTWMDTVNVWREFVVSSSHVCDQSVFKNIREDMEDRWVTNLSEDRKRFYLVSSLLDTHTQILSFCDNKYFPSSWKDDTLGYLSMDLKVFRYRGSDYSRRTGSLGWTSPRLLTEKWKSRMDKSNIVAIWTNFWVLWWKQYQQEFPDMTRMVTQYLVEPATSVSPERFFSRVGLVQTDLSRILLDTTMIDLMLSNKYL